MRKLIILGCLSYLAIGLGHVAVGAVMEQLVLNYRINYEAGGQLITNQFLGFLAGVLLAPWLIGNLGRRASIVLAFVGFTAAEAGYTLDPGWWVMLVLALIAGFGFGLGETCIGALVIDTLGDRKASTMSLLEVFFGVGAFALPAAAAWLIMQGHWLMTFGTVAVLAAVVLLLWLFVPLGEAEAHMGNRRQREAALAASAEAAAEAGAAAETAAAQSAADAEHAKAEERAGTAHAAEHAPAMHSAQAERMAAQSAQPVQPAKASRTGYSRWDLRLLLLGAAFFAVYVGLEMSFANYLPTIMGRKAGMGESSATISLSLFWAAMSFGRLFVGRITGRVGYRNFLLTCCVCTVAGFAVLSLLNEAASATGLIIVTGLAMAGIFAMALVYLNEAFPDNVDRTTSILIACGGLGGALLPKVTGWLLDAYDVNTAMWQFTACAGILLLLMGLIVGEQGRLRQRRKDGAAQPNG